MEKERDDKGFSIKDLVKIGDHIHESKTALIISDIAKPDGTHSILGSATGNRRDIVLMIYSILKDNKGLEELISEAVLMKKMEDIHAMFSKIQNGK